VNLRRLVWHPILVLCVLLLAAWELFFAPHQASRLDLLCAPILIAWTLAVGLLARRDGAL